MARLVEHDSNQLFKTLEDWNRCLIDPSLGPSPPLRPPPATTFYL